MDQNCFDPNDVSINIYAACELRTIEEFCIDTRVVIKASEHPKLVEEKIYDIDNFYKDYRLDINFEPYGMRYQNKYYYLAKKSFTLPIDSKYFETEYKKYYNAYVGDFCIGIRTIKTNLYKKVFFAKDVEKNLIYVSDVSIQDAVGIMKNSKK